MNEQDKRRYEALYQHEKETLWEYFFPEAVAKDVLVALLVFLVLVALAAFVGAPLEAPANPGDASYVPKPEWYFLFLYEMLKFFPGNLIVVGVVVLPGIVFTLMFALPALDSKPERHPRNRPVVIGALFIAWLVILAFTAYGMVFDSHEVEPNEIVAGLNVADEALPEGQQLYEAQCALCHGTQGEGGKHPTRPDQIIYPISSAPFLATFTDDTLYNLIDRGLPGRGMSAFGVAHGGPLPPEDIETIVGHIRAWEADPPVDESALTELQIPPPIEEDITAEGGDVDSGAELYAFWCARCHGDNGELVADSMIALNTPGLYAELDPAVIIDGIINGQGQMPAFGGAFSPQDLRDLLAFLQSLSSE